MTARIASLLILLSGALNATAADPGNRLTYLDEFADPYYVGLDFAKLATPQWIGEEEVEAVIVLSIDDLRDPVRFEAFLRPVLERLKQIDGRAPVSCMGNQLDLEHPLLRQWLAEGLSIEPHTYHHPCPILQKGDFEHAKTTYDLCVDQMFDLPGAHPVAFRMPCCDSMNSISPRFFAEVFNKTTPRGNFLHMDSSVFMLHTPADTGLSPEILAAEQRRSRFDKYVPRDRGFVNYVENYPYPYVIARLCWELPSSIPDDWQGHNLQKPHHPVTIADMKAAIDAVVSKQGIYVLTHHAGAWIRNDQVIELIDHAVGRYGGKVKFLNFREVYDRLTKNLLGGQPLRAKCGGDNGVRVLDLNNDGFIDVVISNESVRQTRIWSPAAGDWIVGDFPAPIVSVDAEGNRRDAGARFGVLQSNGFASVLVHNETTAGLWHFDGEKWVEDASGLAGLVLDGPVHTSLAGRDAGVRLRDLDGNGICELIAGGPQRQGVFRWTGPDGWTRLPFSLPPATAVVDQQGRDAGLRFVDVDEDGRADVAYSHADRYSLHLFTSMQDGWERKVLGGPREEGGRIPMIVRADGTNNGAWFSFRHMWVQNEETGSRFTPSQTESRSYEALLGRE